MRPIQLKFNTSGDIWQAGSALGMFEIFKKKGLFVPQIDSQNLPLLFPDAAAARGMANFSQSLLEAPAVKIDWTQEGQDWVGHTPFGTWRTSMSQGYVRGWMLTYQDAPAPLGFIDLATAQQACQLWMNTIWHSISEPV